MREFLNPLGIETLAFLHGSRDFSEHLLDLWRKALRTRYLAFCKATPPIEHILERRPVTVFAFPPEFVHSVIEGADGVLKQGLDAILCRDQRVCPFGTARLRKTVDLFCWETGSTQHKPAPDTPFKRNQSL